MSEHHLERVVSLFPTGLVRRAQPSLPPIAHPPVSVREAERLVAEAAAELDEAVHHAGLLGLLPPPRCRRSEAARGVTIDDAETRVARARAAVAEAEAALRDAWKRSVSHRHREDLWEAQP